MPWRVSWMFPEMILSDRRGEARPAGATFKFGAAFEQRQSAQAAGIQPLSLLVEENAAERRFLAMFEQQMSLFLAELRNQLPQLVLGGRRQIELHFDDVSHRQISLPLKQSGQQASFTPARTGFAAATAGSAKSAVAGPTRHPDGTLLHHGDAHYTDRYH